MQCFSSRMPDKAACAFQPAFEPWQHGSDQCTFIKNLLEYLILCGFDDMFAGCRTASQTQQEPKKM
ncbi:hypothetical protein EJB05_14894, partial [Eragrostis curvula]